MLPIPLLMGGAAAAAAVLLLGGSLGGSDTSCLHPDDTYTGRLYRGYFLFAVPDPPWVWAVMSAPPCGQKLNNLGPSSNVETYVWAHNDKGGGIAEGFRLGRAWVDSELEWSTRKPEVVGGVAELVRRFGGDWGWSGAVQSLCIAAAWTESRLRPSMFAGTVAPPGYALYIEPVLGPIGMSKRTAKSLALETAAAVRMFERNSLRFDACDINILNYTAGSYGAWQLLPVVVAKAFWDTEYACMDPVSGFIPQIAMVSWYAYLASLQNYSTYRGTAASGRAGFRSLAAMHDPSSEGALISRKHLIDAIAATGVRLGPDDELGPLDKSTATYARWATQARAFIESASSLGTPSYGVPLVELDPEQVQTMILRTQSPWSVCGKNFLGDVLLWREGLNREQALSLATSIAPAVGREWIVYGQGTAAASMRTALTDLGFPVTTAPRPIPSARARTAARTRRGPRRPAARSRPSPVYQWRFTIWTINPGLTYESLKVKLELRNLSEPGEPIQPPVVEDQFGFVINSSHSVFATDYAQVIIRNKWATHPGEIVIVPHESVALAQSIAKDFRADLGAKVVVVQ